ncbi:Endo-1,4-beta-xylanase A precursor [Micromonospora sp. MW-13]|uniref:RICIN domain-containing protein n=1 Tax=Micromonospora sp. MW-13 TaxID=2094022 RepID=UPI000EE9BB0D|nr:RICIN domain-containing protein [Micromonospora sp. MW-13]RGC65917.1 Endo-1,4-beta-xylanase A precursor [Micromonospora sp. MW-13]
MIEASGKTQSESLPGRSRDRRGILRVALESLLGVFLASGLLLLGAGAAQAGAGTPQARGSATPGTQAIDFYEFRARHSDKCLDVANASIAHGTPIVQGNCWGGTNQHWRWIAVGNGYYEIRAQHSDKCLDVANASTAHGTPVVQGNCWGGTNQHWRLVLLSNGFYEIRAQHSDKCLDVANASTAHGARVVQGDCWGGTNQHWRLAYAGTWG